MKKVILGFVLLIGLWATSNAQIGQAKSNKEIAVQLIHNNLDGYLLQIQPLDGSLYYQVEVTVDGASIKVSPTEFSILEFLARHPGQVFNTTALLDRVWKSTADVSPDTVRVYIRRLRDKFKEAGHPELLQNIHGVGYKLQLPE